MERRVINPWTWRDAFGYVQANDITGAERVLICSGQASVDANGHPLHAGDMAAQIAQSLDNIETVLEAAGFSLTDIMRLNVYTTDVDGFLAASQALGERLGPAGTRAASTLLGVTRLAMPELLVELEATAVK